MPNDDNGGGGDDDDDDDDGGGGSDDFCQQNFNIVWTSLRVLGVSNYWC